MGLIVCIGWWLLAVAVANRWNGPAALGTAAVLAGIAGTTLPDLDLLLPLNHRSAITHSLLPIALAGASRRWRPVAAGLAIGIGLHLAADSFPNGMRGFATVKLPLGGSIGATASYVWLGAQAIVATATGAVLLAASVPGRAALVAAAALALTGIAYLFVTDGGWPVLALYSAFGWIAVRRRGSRAGTIGERRDR